MRPLGVLWEQGAGRSLPLPPLTLATENQGNCLIQSTGNTRLICCSINTGFWKTDKQEATVPLFTGGQPTPVLTCIPLELLQLIFNSIPIGREKVFPTEGACRESPTMGVSAVLWTFGPYWKQWVISTPRTNIKRTSLGRKMPPEATVGIQRPSPHSVCGSARLPVFFLPLFPLSPHSFTA